MKLIIHMRIAIIIIKIINFYNDKHKNYKNNKNNFHKKVCKDYNIFDDNEKNNK